MTSANPFVFSALIQLIFPHFLLSSHFFLCGCPNRAPISSTAVTLLNTHTNNSFGKARFNPLLLCSIYGLSISLLTRGQHEFGSVCCFLLFSFFFLKHSIETLDLCNKWFQFIFCICVNPIRIMAAADGYIPTCRENPILA